MLLLVLPSVILGLRVIFFGDFFLALWSDRSANLVAFGTQEEGSCSDCCGFGIVKESDAKKCQTKIPTAITISNDHILMVAAGVESTMWLTSERTSRVNFFFSFFIYSVDDRKVFGIGSNNYGQLSPVKSEMHDISTRTVYTRYGPHCGDSLQSCGDGDVHNFAPS
mgnify:CR=1 FL=1